MKVRVFIVVFAFFTANFLIAQESFPFSDFIAEDGSGIEKLQKLQNEKADKKAVYTTHDSVSDACEQVELVTVLLDEAVMNKVRELPAEQGMIILKSHLLWWKYFRSVPSMPDVNGSASGIFSLMTDFSRIKSRWEALKLPYQQYLVYAKIANLCRVRLKSGTYKMRFGEVCLKKDACWANDEDAVKTYGKYYHSFPVSIVAETCQKTEEGFSAVLQTGKAFYFCVWDSFGMPLAVHSLGNVKKVVSVTPNKSGSVEIVCLNKNKGQQKSTINLSEQNQTKITEKE